MAHTSIESCKSALLLALKKVSDAGMEVYYILTDHLGPTSLTYRQSDGQIDQQGYAPWGTVRRWTGELPTDYTFTGQREVEELGLIWYQSRFYDPVLGRWTKPDTVVPLASQGTQAWDRFAYANNNAIRYDDPNGHAVACEYGDSCKHLGPPPPSRVWRNPVEPMVVGGGWDFGEERGNGTRHDSGVDINADDPSNPSRVNPDIVASSYGVVYVSTACTLEPCSGISVDTNAGYGNVVIIGYNYNNLPPGIQAQLPLGPETVFVLYAHLNEPSSLNEGDWVLPGQVIGQMGTTGASDGVHLHLEIRIEQPDRHLIQGDMHKGQRYTLTHGNWHNRRFMIILNPHNFFEIQP